MSCFNKLANLYELSKMCFCDLFEEGKIKSMGDLNETYNLNLNPVGYFNLCGAAIHNKEMKKGLGGNSTSMSEYFSSFKKGLKSCRNILAKSEKLKFAPCKLPNIVTFF